MPSPLGLDHGRRMPFVIIWLGHYLRYTAGVDVLDNVTTIMGPRSEVQPDVQLRILPERGGQTRDEGAYVGGGPELVVEVSISIRRIDLGPKLRDYEAAGVLEYVVASGKPEEILWHERRDGRLVRVSPDPDGLHRSNAFPGLWLDPVALLARDLHGLIATLDRGLATPEHAAFVARLAAILRLP